MRSRRRSSVDPTDAELGAILDEHGDGRRMPAHVRESAIMGLRFVFDVLQRAGWRLVPPLRVVDGGKK